MGAGSVVDVYLRTDGRCPVCSEAALAEVTVVTVPAPDELTATQQVVLAVDQQGVDRWFDLLSGCSSPRSRSWPGADVVVVLLLAAGAGWESAALAALSGRSDVVVLKRCVDVADLLATAAAARPTWRSSALDAPGLDATAVDRLRGEGVRTVAVLPRGGDPDAAQLAPPGSGSQRASPTTTSTGSPRPSRPTTGRRPLPEDRRPPPGRVDRDGWWRCGDRPARRGVRPSRWGWPPRSAATTARCWSTPTPTAGRSPSSSAWSTRSRACSRAARLVATGQLAERFAGVQRSLDHRFSVVTGLPRADRWPEIRAGVVEHLLEVAQGHGHVVVDTGFCLEDDPALDQVAARPGATA